MNTLATIDRALESTDYPRLDTAPATPFIKWAGGKRAIMPTLIRHFPDKIATYWEPFVGGGAAFFALADTIDEAILSDTNEDLVIAYTIVKNDLENLIDRLHHHAKKHTIDEYYLQVRGQNPSDDLARAARFIYLNKTCYNGLYRVNGRGRFNVPKGRYTNPSICDEERLRIASTALQKATIKRADFSAVVTPKPGDFIYCDPPYDDCFTNYQAGGFTADDQTRLRDKVAGWAQKGVRVMVSNSNTPLIRNLYRDKIYRVHYVKAPRIINSKASQRRAIRDIMVKTYD